MNFKCLPSTSRTTAALMKEYMFPHFLSRAESWIYKAVPFMYVLFAFNSYTYDMTEVTSAARARGMSERQDWCFE